uniref:Uncharacterized protein n=1 Tax=Eutreptiella gymnastica TaxID=73025 RepID=A0A7S1JF47_9EUGL
MSVSSINHCPNPMHAPRLQGRFLSISQHASFSAKSLHFIFYGTTSEIINHRNELLTLARALRCSYRSQDSAPRQGCFGQRTSPESSAKLGAFGSHCEAQR